KSLYYLLEGLKQMKVTGDSTQLGESYSSMGMIYKNEGEVQKSIEFLEASFNFYKTHRDYDAAWRQRERIAAVLIIMKKYEEALSLIKYTIGEIPQESDYQKMTMNHAMGLCYGALKQNDRAEKYLLESLNLAQKVNEDNVAWFG